MSLAVFMKRILFPALTMFSALCVVACVHDRKPPKKHDDGGFHNPTQPSETQPGETPPGEENPGGAQNPPTPPTPPPSHVRVGEPPMAKPVPGMKGHVYSPYAPHNVIDVRGVPQGALVRDTSTNGIFRRP